MTPIRAAQKARVDVARVLLLALLFLRRFLLLLLLPVGWSPYSGIVGNFNLLSYGCIGGRAVRLFWCSSLLSELPPILVILSGTKDPDLLVSLFDAVTLLLVLLGHGPLPPAISVRSISWLLWPILLHVGGDRLPPRPRPPLVALSSTSVMVEFYDAMTLWYHQKLHARIDYTSFLIFPLISSMQFSLESMHFCFSTQFEISMQCILNIWDKKSIEYYNLSKLLSTNKM